MFSVAALYPVSLTPRFSEVQVQVYDQNGFSGLLALQQKTAEAVGARSGVITPS